MRTACKLSRVRTRRLSSLSVFFLMHLRSVSSMYGQSSLPRCWQAPLQRALPVGPAIRLRGIPVRPLDHFLHRLLPRALAVHFPALSRRPPLLQDRLRDRAGAALPAAAVVEAAEAAGKRAGRSRVSQDHSANASMKNEASAPTRRIAPQFSHVTAVTARSALLGPNSSLVVGSKNYR